MSGAHSRNKGRRGELEWAKKTGGRRANDEGLTGYDVIHPPIATLHPPLEKAEVKRVGKLPKSLQAWIDQMKHEHADYIAFRQDRDHWYLIIPAERLDL